MKKHYKYVQNIFEKKKVVSFDLYDTLVNRLVESEVGRFQLLEDEYNQSHDTHICGFASERVNAENRLRESRQKCITIEKIYECMDMLDDKQKEELIELENCLEVNVAYTNSTGWNLYNLAMKLKKRIVIVSDMYLHREILEKILEKCGYIGYERIFVSGEDGEAKSDFGRLFEVAYGSLDVSHSEVVHVGDNWRSDWLNSTIRGICNIKVIPDRKDTFLKFVNNICETNSNSLYYEIGYRFFAPLAVGYCSWIHEKCIEKGIRKVYFFAREGKMLKEIFESYYGDVDSEYLYVSRQALTLPLLKNCKSISEMAKLCALKSDATIELLLDRLGIKNQTILNCLKKVGFKLTDLVYNIHEPKRLYDIIFDSVQLVSNEQYINCCSYFKSIGLFDMNDNSTIAIVDVGWEGNMQKCFVSLLEDAGYNYKIEGFFVGQKSAMKEHINNGLLNTGFLYNYNEINELRMMINSSETLLEVMLFANHGTTLGYSESGPILKEIEYSDEVINKLLEVRNGILAFSKDIYALQSKYSIITKSNIQNCFEQLVVNLPQKYVEEIADWEFLDNNTSKIVERVSPFNLKKFLHEFRYCGWKTAYLKLNTRVNLPYYSAYKLAEKIRIKRRL